MADFLAADMKRGIIPPTFLPLQSGVGNIANAVLGALGRDKTNAYPAERDRRQEKDRRSHQAA